MYVCVTGSLAGSVTHIWAAAVLHVLSKAECDVFLTNALCLLCCGGSLYGWTLGATEAKQAGYTPNGKHKRWVPSVVSIVLTVLLAPVALPILGAQNHHCSMSSLQWILLCLLHLTLSSCSRIQRCTLHHNDLPLLQVCV